MDKYNSLINTICVQLSPNLTKEFLAMMGHYMAYENKNREQEKMLEIIFKKKVDIPYLCELFECIENGKDTIESALKQYNDSVKNRVNEHQLTLEEFELLKRYVCMLEDLKAKYKRYSDLYFKRDCINEWIIDEKTPEEKEEMLALRKELQDAGIIPQNDFLAPNHIALMKEINNKESE